MADIKLIFSHENFKSTHFSRHINDILAQKRHRVKVGHVKPFNIRVYFDLIFQKYELIECFGIKAILITYMLHFSRIIPRSTKVIYYVTGVGSFFQLMESNNRKSLFVKFLYKGLIRYKYINFLFENSDDYYDFKKIAGLEIAARSYYVKGAGVDLEALSETPWTRPKNRTINILYCGRLIKDKGIVRYFEIANRMADNKKYQFHIMGDIDENNPSSISKSDLYDALSENTNLYYDGVQNFRAVAHKYDCLLSPSRREGYSLAMCEAACCGVPLVASNVAGNRSFMTDLGLENFLVDDDNIEEYGEKLDVLFNATDLDLLSKSTSIIARKLYDINSILSTHNEVIHNVIDNH